MTSILDHVQNMRAVERSNARTELQRAERDWELSKFTTKELKDELTRRAATNIAELYARKDVVDITGDEPVDTEAI